MMRKFTKEYTREFSLLMGQVFLYSFFDLFKELPGTLQVPYVEYRTDGANQYWEEANGLQVFLDALLEKSLHDQEWYERKVTAYKHASEIAKKYQNVSLIQDVPHLVQILDEIIKGVAGWSLMYYGPTDNRTPTELRKASEALRMLDSLGDDSDELLRKSLKKLYPQLHGLELELAYKDLRDLNVPDKYELEQRCQHSVLYPHDGVVDILPIPLSECAARYPELQFEVERADTSLTEITGQSAYKGRVAGIARIVRRRDQIAEVNEGDILISPMTTPHFLPAMQKAAAIVTDEGGVTSHAAILAREMRKPTVIGTRVATQIFKDGDMVEVDAEKGIVRKI